MANTFKNAGVAIGDSATTIYTAPANTTGVIHAVYISNIDGANDATVDITVTDSSAGTTFLYYENSRCASRFNFGNRETN